MLWRAVEQGNDQQRKNSLKWSGQGSKTEKLSFEQRCKGGGGGEF